MYDFTYDRAMTLREHLIAIGQTKIWLDRYIEPPYDIFTRVEPGGSYRLSIPVGVTFIGEKAGLEFAWSMDLETREANGRGVYLFDRERIRDVAMKLTPYMRKTFATYLKATVLSAVSKQSSEIREALNANLDTEDCIHGLIAFAEEPS